MEKTSDDIYKEVEDISADELNEMLNEDMTEPKEESYTTENDKSKKPKNNKHHKKHRPKRFPWHGERYPHTHFYIPGDPQFDAQKYLHLLNSWLLSLTELGAKLARDSKEGDLKLTQELYDIIQKLKECRDLLNTYLQLYFQNEQNAYNDLYDILYYIGNTLIPKLNARLKALFECVENRLKVHDKYIDDIFNYINDIYNILQSLVANDYETKTLVKGTDYTITFYNGWYQADDNAVSPVVRRYRTAMNTPYGDYITDEIRFSETANNAIYNSNVVNSSKISGDYAPYFRHGNNYEDVPTSWKWKIDFSDSDYKTPTSTSQFGNDVCNVRPISARASWPVKCSLHTENGSVLCCMDSIGDGWNSQYERYISEGYATELNFLANTNCNMSATYNYKKS